MLPQCGNLPLLPLHRSRVESCKCCTEPLVSNRNDDRKCNDDRRSTIRLYIHPAVVGIPGLIFDRGNQDENWIPLVPDGSQFGRVNRIQRLC